jgi:hypothetical protein
VQPSCLYIADDDGLDSIDTVHADNLGVLHYCHLGAFCLLSATHATQARRHDSRVPTSQNQEYALTVPHGFHGCIEYGSFVARENDIDRRAPPHPTPLKLGRLAAVSPTIAVRSRETLERSG